MRLVIFTDIDDTLMTTPRKLAATEGLLPGSVRPDGTVTSYRTPEQVALWDSILRKADAVIPVSARSAQAYGRLQLSFAAESVLDFGGTVYDASGNLDVEWARNMMRLSDEHRTRPLFEHIEARLAPQLAAQPELRVSANDQPCFLNFRFRSSLEKAIGREVLRTFLCEEGLNGHLHFHETDRDVTLLPLHVSKQAAVRHVINKYGYTDALRIGMGDSLSDAHFMQACHFQLVPSDSRAALALGQAAAEEGRG